jgi:hypothetical protein
MAKTLPRESQAEFELPPADTHIATCYRIIDLGTQKVEWQGAVKFQHKIMISWELAAKMADDRPFSVHKRYTYSSHEKSTFRQDLESWRGVPFTQEDLGKFQLANLLGKACLIGIVHTSKNGNNYANISSIMKLPRGMAPPPLVNPMLEFDLDEFNQDIYNGLSQGLRDTIALSPEYAQVIGKGKPSQEELTGHLRDGPPMDVYGDEIGF